MEGGHEGRMTAYKRVIREIADFPKAGIGFKDLTPLFADGALFTRAVDELAATCREQDVRPDRIVCPEARGFILGAALAYRLEIGFAPIRKPGKLPYHTAQIEYELEYGTDRLEMHVDAISPGERILIADDLLATGGTTRACARLVEKAGGVVAACTFLVELTFLKGRALLEGFPIISLVQYE